MKYRVVGALIVAVYLGASLMAAPVKPTGTVSIIQLAPQVGDSVTFSVSVANLPLVDGGQFFRPYYPVVEVTCWQGGVEVFDGYGIADPQGDGRTYTTTTYPLLLNWAGGAGDCTAYLFYDRIARSYSNHDPGRTNSNTLATQNVTVAP